jgi:NHL repeat
LRQGEEGEVEQENQSRESRDRTEGEIMRFPVAVKLSIAVAVTVVLLAGADTGGAVAAAAPVKLKLSSHFGREVNLSEAGKGLAPEDVCTAASGDACRPGRESSIAGGFAFPADVTVAPDGDVYVADRNNYRVQELTASGGFVLMFGAEVNQTKVEEVKAKGATPTQGEIEEEDVCTAASGNVCTQGVRGGAAGAFKEPASVAVDPASGDVYVLDGDRVDEYTAQGGFVWTVGGQVNRTKVEEVKAKGGTPTAGEIEEENICTAASKALCQTGARAARGSGEHRVFDPNGDGGDLLVVGPAGVLYVGDEGRVQKLDPSGAWLGQIPLAGRVGALAVDETGNVYLAYAGAGSVRELRPGGEQFAELAVSVPGQPQASLEIATLALDPHGHLAVGALTFEPGGAKNKWFGSLYEAATGHLISRFSGWGSPGIAFGPAGELYAAAKNNPSTGTGHEVLGYEVEPIAELVVKPVACVAGPEHESDATLDCVLNGEVNPEGVAGTEAWFQYGSSCALLGSETSRQSGLTGSALVPVSALVAGLRPDQTLCDQVAGNDANVPSSSGETLTSTENTSLRTPLAPPNVVGEPRVSFVKSSSAVMFGELNPENARTEYFFEYGPGETLGKCAQGIRYENCPGVAGTSVAQSPCPQAERNGKLEERVCLYGKLGVTLEARGLASGTLYHYRLFAENENTARTETRTSVQGPHPSPEGQFTTAPAPLPQASTGPAGSVGATTATIAGSVNPDGLPATYAFELGVYEGANTSYGIVISGSAGAGTIPVQESLALTGLRPGTIYAYRITVSSGYIPNATHTLAGEPMLFTTQGLPEVLSPPSVLAQLPVPPIALPKEPGNLTTRKLTRAQRLANALRACARKPKRERAACRRSAQKKYASKPKQGK